MFGYSLNPPPPPPRMSRTSTTRLIFERSEFNLIIICFGTENAEKDLPNGFCRMPFGIREL